MPENTAPPNATPVACMLAFNSWADEWLKDTHPAVAKQARDLARLGFVAAWHIQQATIDRLMLEHCPDEMTPEQLVDWEQNQRGSGT